MVPAGMLAYQLGIRTILVAPVVAYDDVGTMHEQPVVLGFPGSDQLAGHDVLVVDEVWETGNTITAVVERVRAAGGRPVTAVLHYKPTRSRTDLRPDTACTRRTAGWSTPTSTGSSARGAGRGSYPR